MITVIVPVYKVEKYIDKCIESIINQSYGDLDIVLVDDGSPDRCGIICDNYAEKDSRIQVIHKVNEGVGKARQSGLAVAKGEYITFVDGDDYIESDFCETMLRIIIENEVDWVSCNMKKINGLLNYRMRIIEKDRINQKASDFFNDYINHYLYTLVVWGKLYKKTILEKIRFKDFKMGEDGCYFMDVVSQTPNGYLSCYSGYCYVSNPSSVSSVKGFNIYQFDMISAIDYIEDRAQKEAPECCGGIRAEKAWRLHQLYLRASEDGEVEYQKTIRKMIYKMKVLNLPLSKKVKVHILILKAAPHVYNLLIK